MWVTPKEATDIKQNSRLFIKEDKKMKSKKKVLVTLLCAVLLVFASVMGTMAFLTDDANVTNTFAVGKVGIDMKEAPVDDEGKATSGDRVTGNTYQLFPGHKYDKDPKITVDANSEDCWLFITVDNKIADIEVAEADGDTVAEQLAKNNWTKMEGTNVYAYKEVVSAGETVPVFETFEIAGTVTNDQLAAYGVEGNNTIIINAYAIQEDGFASAAAAWTAAKGELGFTE